jgi:hypothetical protein
MAETGLSGLHRLYTIKSQFICHALLGKSGLMVAYEKLGSSDTNIDKPFEMKRPSIILVLKKSRFDVNTVYVKFMS